MDLRMAIGGEWVQASSGERLPIMSPATGEQIATVPRATREDVSRAVAAARQAQPAYALMTAFERRKLCLRVTDVILSHRDELARLLSLEQGKPLHAEAGGEVGVAAQMYCTAGEDAVRLEGTTIPSEDPRKRIHTVRVPRGVYGVITPWNFPYAIPSEYLSAGLATGNALVWIPAPTTAACAVKLMECLEEAGVPAGVVNLVTGEGAVVGDELAGHPGIDAIGLTGSPATGLAVSRRAAGKPQLLELGGNAPTIVMGDAEIARAARIAGQGAFWNAGQICDSTERIMVQRSVYDEFLEALVAVAGEFRLGDPLAADVTLGPVHNARQVAQINRHLHDATAKGASIVTGGQVASDRPTSLYFPATVVGNVTADMLLNLEETFGPVVPVLAFDSDEEAVALANSSNTGLVASIFTSDLNRAFRVAEQLQAGIVNMNEGSAYWQPHTPFGGFSGKQSGIGRLGGRYTLEEMTQVKCYVIDVGARD